MRRLILALAIAAACVAAARAQVWIMSPASQNQKHGTPPASTCTSGSLMTGIFDLTNTCNDIYFIGGLK